MNNAKQPISPILGKDGLPVLNDDHTGDYLQARILVLTKREYFAGLAMQGLLASTDGVYSGNQIAEDSVLMADKLLKQLEK